MTISHSSAAFEGLRISNQGCYPALPIVVDNPRTEAAIALFHVELMVLICLTFLQVHRGCDSVHKSEIKGPWRQSRAEICDRGAAPGSSFLTVLGLLSYLSTYEASWYPKHDTIEKPSNLVCAINESLKY